MKRKKKAPGRRLLTVAQAEHKYAHGTNARYTFACCRCRQCTAARTQYMRERTAEKVEAAPWTVSFRGRVSNDGFKTIRVVNRLSGAVERYYTIDTLDRDSCQRIPATAKRRANVLNRRDGKPAAIGSLMVSVKPARAQIARLRAGGMGYKIVAARARIAASVIMRIVGHKTGYRTMRTMRRDARDAILAIDPKALAGGARVDARDALRQLDRLIRNGWAKGFLASLILGKKVPALQIVARGGTITVRNATRIAAIFEKLHDVKPSYRMTPWGPRPIGNAKKKPAGRASAALTRELLVAIRAADARVKAGMPAPKRALEPKRPPKNVVVAADARQKLRRALDSWDADEFANRFARYSEITQ